MSTGVVILAAGESSRMGRPKQLLAYRDSTLLHHAIETAFSLPTAPVIVLGAHAEEIRAHLTDHRVIIVENPNWREGMGGSLRLGLEALQGAHPEITSAIFLLCDQPLISPSVLADLIATHERTAAPIVASEYDGVLGVPALFAQSLFPELLALDGPSGARHLIHAHAEQTAALPFQEGAIDIDTPDDYARLQAPAAGRAE